MGDRANEERDVPPWTWREPLVWRGETVFLKAAAECRGFVVNQSLSVQSESFDLSIAETEIGDNDSRRTFSTRMQLRVHGFIQQIVCCTETLTRRKSKMYCMAFFKQSSFFKMLYSHASPNSAGLDVTCSPCSVLYCITCVGHNNQTPPTPSIVTEPGSRPNRETCETLWIRLWDQHLTIDLRFYVFLFYNAGSIMRPAADIFKIQCIDIRLGQNV